ncbi:hypothetical protein DFJ73DRAFT_830297 [Zopfochytrium polystomum]|nr:hypothetical protein DFJ73DRAFT_830297 [Zopfochytrium polystomum]
MRTHTHTHTIHQLTESEIRELFYEFTTVVSARLGFDNAGRSTGVATVLFTSKVEADKAYTWCSNLTIDG